MTRRIQKLRWKIQHISKENFIENFEAKKGKIRKRVSRLDVNAILGEFSFEYRVSAEKEGKHPVGKAGREQERIHCTLFHPGKLYWSAYIPPCFSSFRPNYLCCCSPCVVPSANCKHLTRLFDEQSIKEISFARCAAGFSEKFLFFRNRKSKTDFIVVNRSAWRLQVASEAA